jgi:hypothetical protein
MAAIGKNGVDIPHSPLNGIGCHLSSGGKGISIDWQKVWISFVMACCSTSNIDSPKKWLVTIRKAKSAVGDYITAFKRLDHKLETPKTGACEEAPAD